MVKSETDPVHRGQGEIKEREPTLEWSRAGFISKETYKARRVDFCPPPRPPESYKFTKRPQWGSVTYTAQMVSVTPSSLKAASSKQLLVWAWRPASTFQGRGAVRSLPLPGFSLRVAGRHILSMTPSAARTLCYSLHLRS